MGRIGMVRLPPLALGLCAGGGGAWGGLKVEGLEKALLAQVRVLRRWLDQMIMLRRWWDQVRVSRRWWDLSF